jgi:hypothetical protein
MRATAELGYPNLDEARVSWRQAGFVVSDFDGSFAFASRDDVEFHLFETAESGGSGVYLHVTDVDAEHGRWMDAGLGPSGVRDEPWGMREFSIIDPGGNRIRVGTNL